MTRFIYILGIETSCDETAASVVYNGRTVLSDVISSQIDIHRPYGGVVPEIASRNHIEKISFVINSALSISNIPRCKIDAVAVSNGPGLAGALLVGLSYAKSYAYALQKPLIGVNHIEGHICSNYLHSEWEPPYICLVVSGGHTHLVFAEDYGKYRVLGKTRDDAAGEAFDKIARVLGLPYPGGPEIEKLSANGNRDAINFPKAFFKDSLDFSFSGLKSAVMQYIIKTEKNSGYKPCDVAACFQKAVVDVLTERCVDACNLFGVKKLAVAGGVAANSSLRNNLLDLCKKQGIELMLPQIKYCTDNAAMIASCGYYSGKTDDLNLNAFPNISLFESGVLNG
ncbi:MAG: tRNA (adenosine(37)-N6)-threonylcarbamoyltransferase complex transferase subunit TsaD [Defluviitaleaceae bacterium]|nr:tRNA (adenosine(37)-N6)-threonylcarbamoyltransferase complex transferase subunit TsaD [Defluviitaleaceae bacterium]